MNTSAALKMFKDYQKSNPKPNTGVSYRYLLDTFEELFGERELTSISSEEIFQFFEILTEHNSKSTKNHRYAQLNAFFNFITTQVYLAKVSDSEAIRWMDILHGK